MKAMKRTKDARKLQDYSNELMESVSNLIKEFEDVQDNDRELNSDEKQFLILLGIIYDFLAKSELMKHNPDNYKQDDYIYILQSFSIIDEILAKIKIWYWKKQLFFLFL